MTRAWRMAVRMAVRYGADIRLPRKSVIKTKWHIPRQLWRSHRMPDEALQFYFCSWTEGATGT